MLCFIFAGLIVALDQFFKQWIKRTLEIGEVGPEVIPGVMGLTLWENDGAMLNILSGQQWLLAAIAFIAAIVLIMILLRYNEGFWGTLGLAAVLGGTVGNLADRIFNDGKVIDMFRTLFINFPIFNIADIFITLGFLTFLIHFIALSVKKERDDEAHNYAEGEYDEEHVDAAYDDFPEIDSIVAAQTEQGFTGTGVQDTMSAQAAPQSRYAPPTHHVKPTTVAEPQISSPEEFPASGFSAPEIQIPDDYNAYDPFTDTSLALDDLDLDLGSIEDYDIDDLLREYGVEDDD